MRRTLAERVILEAINQRISDPEQIVLQPVEAEIAKLRADLPDALKLNEAELATEQRRMVNFVDFIGEGRGSQALAKALVEAERRVESLTAEVDGLRRSRAKVFRTPPIKWITDRLNSLQEVLECRTAKSARALRTILGPIRTALITPDIGRPFYRAVTTLDALALTETPSAGAEGGSNSLQGGDGGCKGGETRCPRQEIRSRPVAELWPSRSSAVDCLWPSAAERVAERPTDVCHPPGGELSHPPPEGRARQSVQVVEVHDTVRRDAVFACRKQQLRDEPAPRPGQRRHDNRADPIGDRIAGQHQDGAIATWRRRKPDLTPLHRPSPTSLPQAPSRQLLPRNARHQ